ncbi:HRDC domain-containing protein [Candidatus Woesearchaeota archaeon]|nr:HRDC domain-containing protein [Candidatus Woesearchaeota archaeon]
MESEIIKSSKYSVEIKQSLKRRWYIGSIKINSEKKEELKEALDDAMDIALKKLSFIDQYTKREVGSQDEKDNKPIDEGLFIELRMVRQRIAGVENIPAYVIFHDSTLREMTKSKPITKEEFVNIKGSSENKYEKYGGDFINVIKKYIDNLPETSYKSQ